MAWRGEQGGANERRAVLELRSSDDERKVIVASALVVSRLLVKFGY